MTSPPRPEEQPPAKVIPLSRPSHAAQHAAPAPSIAPDPAPLWAPGAAPHAERRSALRATAVPDDALEDVRDRRGFARQSYILRVLGLVLGALCVGGTLAVVSAPAWAWALLAVQSLVWPHLAWWIARRSADPARAEFRNLAVDTVMGGVWVALMQGALLPSAVLVAMLAMDKAAVGGWRLLLRHLPLMALSFLAVWLPLGMPFRLESGLLSTLAAVPLLTAYPIAVAFAVHWLGQRVRAQNRSLRALNRSDVLTGLGNRRAVDEAIAAELNRCERSGRPASLLLIDLDRFKAINDRYGHGFGDEVLRRVGLAIRGCVRDIDTAARIGGDEFVVLLPETEVDTAVYVAIRVRAAIGAQIFERALGLRCTASIGVAGVAPVAQGAQGWLDRADKALYRAKDEGRDCVRAAP